MQMQTLDGPVKCRMSFFVFGLQSERFLTREFVLAQNELFQCVKGAQLMGNRPCDHIARQGRADNRPFPV